MQLFRNVLILSAGVLLPCTHLIADEGRREFRFIDATASNLINDLDNKLMEAIIKGDAKAVKELLAAGANVNSRSNGEGVCSDTKYLSALAVAAKYGNAAIVKALIAAGADVNGIYNLTAKTALMWAAENDQADIVKILIAAGANIEAKDLAQETALFKAARGKRYEIKDKDLTINAVKALIAAGANIEAKDPWSGRTPLMEAAQYNNVNTLKVLITAGADVNVTDNRGLTALDLAAAYGARETWTLLNRLQRN